MAMAAVPELARVRARRRHKIWSHKRKATTTARRADKAWSCVAMKKLPREPDHSRVQRLRRTLDRERIHTCERTRRLRELHRRPGERASSQQKASGTRHTSRHAYRDLAIVKRVAADQNQQRPLPYTLRDAPPAPQRILKSRDGRKEKRWGSIR
jgi:hypothetical protein